MTWLTWNYGEVHRVPHYIKIDSRTVNIPHLVKQKWFQENISPDIFHICGEMTSLFTIECGLRNNKIVHLLVGDELRRKENRKRLADLKEKNTNRLFVFSGERRPDMHGTRYGHYVIIEDFHEFGLDYNYATVVEDAKSGIIEKFMGYFNENTKKRISLNPEQIMNLPIRES